MLLGQGRAMRLFLLTVLTMLAFGANSVLTRAAVEGAGIDPVGFALIRVIAGAVMLALLVHLRGGGWRWGGRRIDGAFWLALYMVGFSLAYLTMDAGVGALILFGGVQVTMFAAALLRRERIPTLRWLGMAIAMAGLVWLLWPGAGPVIAGRDIGYMLAGAIGWGIYSLRGQGEMDALGASAGNFLICIPMVGVIWLLVGTESYPLLGVVLATVSGAVTSGLGYALWYRILPRLSASTASVSQLSAPVVAVLGGAFFLGEAITLQIVLSGTLVLGGIAVAVLSNRT